MSLFRPTLRSIRLGVLSLGVGLALPAGAQSGDAFLKVRIDEARNRAMLEIPAAQLNKEFLHQVTLATGLGTGSLDRGSTGPSGVVKLERRGNRVLMVRDNLNVRAPAGDAANKRAAAESFPRSIVGSFPIDSDNGGVLTVDATSLFLSDAYGIAGQLRGGAGGGFGAPGGGAQGGGGSYRLDANRSYFDQSRTKSFPLNSEVHAVLTFVGDQPNRSFMRVAPDAAALTFEVHHSLVVLPDTTGFRPRVADPRFGFFGGQFFDLSEPFSGDYRNGFISRWRLVPKDPAAYARGQMVEPVKPITYYLDPGIPEPYRTAFRTGGNWWAKVFEAAGFKNAFRVLDLPEGADPMDARYSMLMWIHRTGPGPSVGASYTDPRTGEIIKGMARMDAWRSLIDYNIWAGIVPASGPSGPNVSAEAFTMARRRQHAAHELGHTIGLSHNYIAASQGRASVMDYPVALITVDGNGNIDLRNSYREGPGAWDTLAIRLGYTWYADSAKEAAGLASIMKDGIAKNVRFINDTYANANGSNAQVTRWVEGSTMFESLDLTSKVRRVLIDKFDERAIQPGDPMALLNMRFTQIYLNHRYALEGVVKNVGGMDFTFALRGDGQVPTRVTPVADQRRALDAALNALKPSELTVPERVQKLIPPAPPGFNNDQIWARGSGGTEFDAISLAGGLATEVIGYLLDRDRSARLVLQTARDAQQLSLDEVIGTIISRTWGAAVPSSADEKAVLRASQRAALDGILDLAGDARALPDVRATAFAQIKSLQGRLSGMSAAGDAAASAHIAQAQADIQRFLDGGDKPELRPRYPIITLPWP